ncbi:MAG: hypothetical protein OEY14_16955, partial [Myxococcales bacterium]|nr:hypothetical protein [Myxococcales bacterium]
LVVGEEGGPAAEGIYQVGALADGSAAYYRMSQGSDKYMVVGKRSFGPFGWVQIAAEFADLDLLVLTAHDAAWTETQVLVVSTRPGELDGPPLFERTYDDLEFDDSHTGQTSLVFIASGGGEVLRCTLDLAALRAGHDG